MKPREDMPRCTDSQIAQSCRLTRSQKSTASDASNVSRPTSSGANSRSQMMRVRPAAAGHNVKAATWSAERLSIRLG